MIISTKREALDADINNVKNTILVLSGSTGASGAKIEKFLTDDTGLEAWRKFFLITDLSILSTKEKQDWFSGDNFDRYAVLGGKHRPRNIGPKGAVEDLLTPEGEPDKLELYDFFAKGDKL